MIQNSEHRATNLPPFQKISSFRSSFTSRWSVHTIQSIEIYPLISDKGEWYLLTIQFVFFLQSPADQRQNERERWEGD